MKVGNCTLVKRTNGNIEYVDDKTSFCVTPNDTNYSVWDSFYQTVRASSDRLQTLNEKIVNLLNNVANDLPKEITPAERLARGIKGLMNFFAEFEFEPNFRFVNTLSFKIAESKKMAEDFVLNYFSLMDSQYKTEISQKIKSREFKAILDDIGAYGVPKNRINNRFTVYFGSAGTGKTTLGMGEANNKCVVCNSAMLPVDLMEDFVFESGKPKFQKSALWESMENGEPLVLDEINLLPFESLRYLQGILDGKSEVDYKGNKILIKNGFKVIGTMNLAIGGMVYGLPEPLVDRCADIKEFKLTPSQLMKAITE